MQSLKQYIKGRLKGPITDSDYKRFLANGNLPWKPGYETHKVKSVAAAINDSTYDPYRLPEGFGWRLDERIVEYPWFIARIPAGKGRLLDAGSTLNHPHVLGHPKLREKSCFISTLAPEQWAAWQLGVSYVYEDLRESCFRNDYFDWIACISTIEHVGLDNTMLYTNDSSKNEMDAAGYISCLMELHRILKPGAVLFLSMPFGQQANHGWFQIFDAAMVDRALESFKPKSCRETIYRYLPHGWTVGDRESAKDATYFDIHKCKNYDDDYAAASRAVVCLEMIK